jgi:hypothetical protein
MKHRPLLERLLTALRLRRQGAPSVGVDVVVDARRNQARRILELAGSGLWEGNLARMRNDAPER